MKAKHAFTIISFLAAITGSGQDDIIAEALPEFARISETYAETPFLSFEIEYSYADSTDPYSPFEEMDGLFKIHAGRYWSMLDSIEYVEGNQFRLTVDYRDSSIVVNKSLTHRDPLAMPMLDSLFRAVNILCMEITDINAYNRKVKIDFKPGAEFSKYEITYDPKTYFIRKIKYYRPNSLNEDAETPYYFTALITLEFGDYSTGVIDDYYFREDRFIYKEDGYLYRQPGFSGFELFTDPEYQTPLL